MITLLRATVDAKYHSVEIDTTIRFQLNPEKLHFFDKTTGVIIYSHNSPLKGASFR